MPERNTTSLWRVALVREITVILLIKLTLLLAIKAIWFNEPTVPRDGQQRVEQHLFGQCGAQQVFGAVRVGWADGQYKAVSGPSRCGGPRRDRGQSRKADQPGANQLRLAALHRPGATQAWGAKEWHAVSGLAACALEAAAIADAPCWR